MSTRESSEVFPQSHSNTKWVGFDTDVQPMAPKVFSIDEQNLLYN